MELYSQLAEKVESGDMASVKSLVEKVLSENLPVEEILNKGLVSGMEAIGKKFKENIVFVPEVLVAARAMKAGLELIKPLLARSGAARANKVVIGTVKGDLHDIGKNIVGFMLEGAGYEVIDLGIDVSKEKFIDAARKEGAKIIGLSALLTTTMIYMKEIVASVRESDLKDTVRVIIGGAPVTQSFADDIKADGYAADAPSAVDVVKSLLAV